MSSTSSPPTETSSAIPETAPGVVRTWAEFMPLVGLPAVIIALSLNENAYGWNVHHVVWLLSALPWILLPWYLAPLTTQGVSSQQRFAVGSLLGASLLCWLLWMAPTLDWRMVSTSGTGVLSTASTAAFAVYLRLGWGKPMRAIWNWALLFGHNAVQAKAATRSVATFHEPEKPPMTQAELDKATKENRWLVAVTMIVVVFISAVSIIVVVVQ